MKIRMNPRVWVVSQAYVEVDGERILVRQSDPEPLDVPADAAADLLAQTVVVFGRRHALFVEAGKTPPRPDLLVVSIDQLPHLTRDELRRAAETYGLPVSGTKTEVTDRIRAHLVERDEEDAE